MSRIVTDIIVVLVLFIISNLLFSGWRAFLVLILAVIAWTAIEYLILSK